MMALWVLLQGLTGYSPGKFIARVKVVDELGHPPGAWKALLRTLPLLIEQYGIVGIWAALRNPARQRFGDRWAGTYVVRSGSVRREAAARGIEPDERITYPGKARKTIYRDGDGNEIGFGGAADSAGS
jgi:uncharacterized RDD family membrane protein YckC